MNWPWTKPLNPGYTPEIAPLAARHDLIFGAGDPVVLPPSFSWYDKMGPRKTQWAAPFCVSYTVTHLREWELKQEGHLIDLEPDYLALASGTNGRGNSIQTVTDYARNNGFVRTSDLNIDVTKTILNNLPYQPPVIDEATKLRAKELSIKGNSFLNPASPEELKKTILKSPIGIAFGLESSTFNSRESGKTMSIPTKPFTNYHAVTCTGYNESGLEAFDSLYTTGYYLPWGYPLTSAFVMEELPINWSTIQDNTNSVEIPNNQNRYGKTRNYEQEILVASMMLNQFRRFNNKSVFDAAGRFWQIYIRAVVYGGYSITDMVNDCYNWRRTGRHIFDLNKIR